MFYRKSSVPLHWLKQERPEKWKQLTVIMVDQRRQFLLRPQHRITKEITHFKVVLEAYGPSGMVNFDFDPRSLTRYVQAFKIDI